MRCTKWCGSVSPSLACELHDTDYENLGNTGQESLPLCRGKLPEEIVNNVPCRRANVTFVKDCWDLAKDNREC
jgi:hypothetical protein